MLSHIDRELFSDRCEVVVFNDPQRYVYPIFKNGRSALTVYADRNNLKFLLNKQISRVDEIEIYLRDPLERFISGINTFCQMTMRDHPHLDDHTVSWFAERFLFLNRHYSTQFSWILNLSRYATDSCLFLLNHVDILKTILELKEPDGVKPVDKSQRDRVLQHPDIDMYVRLDQTLVQLIGQKLTMKEICSHMRSRDPAAWDYVITRNQDILNRCIVQD
jgi:hypothetical protein